MWRPTRRRRPTPRPPSSNGCATSSTGSPASPILQILELLVGILLAAGATYFVILPILRPPVDSGDEVVDEGDDPEDDLSPQAVALRALKEIEFDRATGKLSDADYDHLKAKYTAEALAAMRGERTPDVVRRAPDLPQDARRPAHDGRCPEHGPRPEPRAQFCSECGRRLGTAPGYCVRCGTGLESDSRYCNACGARVAA
ncbi:MAG TPA: zinc ribbon domain-containing protein [Gemmatimonadales bacterium]|nr:zinc ribbon domain-containing protein [Gemmatimonadales bacterium]